MSLQDTYSTHFRDYLVRDIHPAESLLLEMGRSRWAQAKFLDLGVGAGRTAWVFGSVVDSYTGLDPVPRMIQACRELFPESPHRQFLEGDARDLSRFASQSIDAVMFSFNGMDHLDLEERRQALKEIRRVLKPDGLFLFSSHNLLVFPTALPRLSLGWMPHRWPRRWKDWRYSRAFYAEVNACVIQEGALARGWAMLPDKAHGGPWKMFYGTPAFQKKFLEENGFHVDRITDGDAKTVTDFARCTGPWWLHYFCRP